MDPLRRRALAPARYTFAGSFLPPLGLLCLSYGARPATAQEIGSCQPARAENYLYINNVRARVFNNGNLFWRGSHHVYEVPRGGEVHALYNAGLWVGGLVGGELRAAAARYGNYISHRRGNMAASPAVY